MGTESTNYLTWFCIFLLPEFMSDCSVYLKCWKFLRTYKALNCPIFEYFSVGYANLYFWKLVVNLYICAMHKKVFNKYFLMSDYKPCFVCVYMYAYVCICIYMYTYQLVYMFLNCVSTRFSFPIFTISITCTHS